MLVTSPMCLSRFDVNFCMSYDFSLTSQSCLPWFGVIFACQVISLFLFENDVEHSRA